jgi:N-acetylglutamate synthase-like GNAT family acetyltransferase
MVVALCLVAENEEAKGEIRSVAVDPVVVSNRHVAE